MTYLYQAVIFDLDGTLRESDPRFMDALHQCLLDLGIHVDSFQWRLTERWVHQYWAQSPELIADVEQYGSEQLWSRFIARLMTHAGHPPRPDEIESFGQRVRDFYQPQSQLMPGALETLTTLRQSGVILGVLSNRQKPFADELENLGISDFFDFTLAAGEVGVWKPDPRIFNHALERAGNIPPEAALYIGDNYFADIVGAAEAGVDAILLNDRGVFTDLSCAKISALPELLPYLADRLPSPT
ncbi:MAG: HAD family hydrolase [Chloroflexi bacterium]|nr:HAD family hydrolase [Chloroflexota bacterium]